MWIALLLIFMLLGQIFFIKFFIWGYKLHFDPEIARDFSYKSFFASWYLIIWPVMICGVSKIFYDCFKELKGLDKSGFNLTTAGIAVLVIIAIVLILLLVVLPIISIRYFIKHNKELAKEEYTHYTYKQVAWRHFVMGLMAPMVAPVIFLVGAIKLDISSSSSSKDRFTKISSSYKDSKGITHYADTIIDNETGYGSTKYEDGGVRLFHKK